MKKTLMILVLLISYIAYGQTSEEHLKNGISKQEKQNFSEAILDYDKAILEDKTNKIAYYNRGSCRLALKEFKSAMSDFDMTIELDPLFVRAYYNRATVFVNEERYEEALPDLDKTIELSPTLPNALTLRGQLRVKTGDKKGACEDFKKAKDIGDKNANKYLTEYCGNEQGYGESLMLDWPESENWKLANSQETEQMMMIEIIHSNETLENWTEIGTMMSIKGVTNVPMDKAMGVMFDQAKLKSPNAKLTFIEKDESVLFPWIIFTIEASSFTSDAIPESQLWYIVQGKQALYTNFRAVKKAVLPQDLKDKWTAFFKTGKVLYK